MGVYERQLKQEAILDAATEVFCSRGFGATRMMYIAREARLSKGLLYFYYQSKDDLYMAVILRAIKHTVEFHQRVLQKNGDKPGLDRLMELLDAYFVFIREHPYYQNAISTFINRANPLKDDGAHTGLTDAMKESPFYQQIVDLKFEPLRLITEALEQGKQDGSIKTKLEPVYLYLSVWSLMIGYDKLSVAGDQPAESGELFQVFDEKQWQSTIRELVRTILTTP